jgi:acetyl esterase
MSLDVSAQQLLEQIRAAGGKPMESLPLAEARAGYVRSRVALAPDPAQVAEVRDFEFPSGIHSVRARLYRGVDAPLQLAPVVAFFHGGGWALGNLDSHDSFCRGLANDAKCAVVAVDYRLAPEHRFPAAVDDAEAAVAWIAREGERFGLDPSRIAVAGDSAGGNLAAVAALASRQVGVPKIRLQVLIYASFDLSFGHDSHRRVGEGYTLTASAMRWFRDMYLLRPEDALSWRASPLRREDLAGVAPAFIVVSGCDPLCDESADYAQRLIAAGVDVTYRFYPGQMHGFVPAGRVLPEGRVVCAEIASALRSAFATAPSGVRR